jgi:hypothetical protein
MNKGIVLLFILAGIHFSCKKQPSRSHSVKTDSTKVVVVDSVYPAYDFEVKNIDFIYFHSKSKFTYKDADNDIDATLNIRIKKDSIIWINVTPALGVEAVRGIIRPDSIIIVNKIAKDYYVYDFPSLSKKFNFNVNFQIIQALLMGNMPFPRTVKDKISLQGEYYQIKQQTDTLITDNYINIHSLKLEKLVFSQPFTTNSLTVNYANFIAVEPDKMIPFVSSLSLDYFFEGKKLNTFITINHQKPEFSDKGLKFPFNIPHKYERK